VAGGDDGTGRSSTTGDDAPDPFDSIFDDLFVAGARYSEPTAAERAREAKEAQRRAKERRRSSRRAGRRSRIRRSAPWLVLVVVAVALVGVNEWRTSGDEGAQTVSIIPDHVEVVYAHASTEDPDADVAEAVQHEADVAIAWLEEQRGAPLHVDRDGELPRIRTVELLGAEDELMGSTAQAYRDVWSQLVDFESLDTTFLVFADVRTELDRTDGAICGQGDAGLTIVWLGNCPFDQPSTDSEWGDGTTVTVAHELLHSMGAAPDCAPHATIGGHVDDSPADILYESPDAQSSGPEVPVDEIRIDVGGDDYLEHGIANCPDISDSRLWGEPE
jgi:hypothetical protein